MQRKRPRPPKSRQRDRKSNPRQRPLNSNSRQHAGNPKPRQRTLTWVWRQLLLPSLTVLILTGATGVAFAGVWLGLRLTVDPQAAMWLQHLLPEWTDIPIDRAQAILTLSEIRTQLEREGRIAARPVSLSSSEGSNAAEPGLLLPVMVEPNRCRRFCQQIVELRVYEPIPPAYTPRGDRTYYRLVSQLSIAGPTEAFATAPLVPGMPDQPPSTRTLPLTELRRFEQNAPDRGVWLNLFGKWKQGDRRIAYGQVFHYNRDRQHLSRMLQWTSPARQLPVWEQFTGDDTVELVVDRTIGLEPEFAVYQLQPRNFLPDPIQLVEISLNQPAHSDSTYRDALLLARNGLWSLALEKMRSAKQQLKRSWSASAQAQLDLIEFHAQIAQTQAEAAWASPSQQVLAQLIDGRWEAALQVLEAQNGRAEEIATLLETDSGRLWKRVETALRVQPDNDSAKIWGVLTLALQQDRDAARTWLQQQDSPLDSDSRDRLDTLLEQLGTNVLEARNLSQP